MPTQILKKTLKITAAAFLLTTPSFGITLFVDNEDPACSDVTASPYCTINAAVADTQPGDRVMIAEGNYGESLLVTKAIFIEGAGAGLTTIDGGAQPTLDLRGTVTVEKMTITGAGNRGVVGVGLVRILDSEIVGNSGPGGGGIHQTGGTLEVTRTVIHGNTSDSNLNGAGGAGIWNERGELFVIDSAIVDNQNVHPTSPGGGVSAKGDLASFTRTRISDNSTMNNGGGISAINMTVTLVESVVSGNFAGGSRGGIGVLDVELTLVNTTVSRNISPSSAGIFVSSGGSLELRNATIAQNMSTTTNGVGVSISSTSTSQISNTIIAGNMNLVGNVDCSGTFTSEGYNLIQNPGGFCTIVGDSTGNLIGVDPLLLSLSGHGGGTLTHALATGSPAIDAGHPAAAGSLDEACPLSDQRGVTRPQDGNRDGQARCDIGAYEADNPIFADGFELGNLDRWSASTP